MNSGNDHRIRKFLSSICSARLSDLQPIVGDQLLGADVNINGFKGTALAQAPQLLRNGRTTDPEFPSHVRRERPDEPRLRIDAPPRILHYALTKVKRNLRRTPPRIPSRSMRFSHLPLSYDFAKTCEIIANIRICRRSQPSPRAGASRPRPNQGRRSFQDRPRHPPTA